MGKDRKVWVSVGFLLFLVAVLSTPAWGYEVNRWFSIYGTFTGTYQWLEKSAGVGDNEDDGSGVFDLTVSIKPWEGGEFSGRASFAKGNGLKNKSPFVLSPNADDLEDDLKNINGHKWQDHLQELWYAHTIRLQENLSFKVTGGIIDATAFIDDNSYANDELGQFVNEVFVNNPIANLPSYDIGGAVELEWDAWHLRFVSMTSKNDDGNNYAYFALQLGYKLETPLGEGNYRIYGFLTNEEFLKGDGEKKASLRGFGVSFDQQIIKDVLGAFFRAGWQDDEAFVYYDKFISFGLNVSGSTWGRKNDEIGIGYAYLDGSTNSDVAHTHALETYLKFHIFEYKAVSANFSVDFQYMNDDLRDGGKNEGYIWGIRFNMSF
ncbi:MAG: carbohydrate porin [Syntrophobacterales bacterium]|nr:carbohydrate porin [Syntrophobacterales bacterium]